MVYTKEIYTQMELNDFLTEYNSEYVDLIIKATEDITLETNKTLTRINVNYSGYNCKFIVKTPLGRVNIHHSDNLDFTCKLPNDNFMSIDIRYVSDSTIRLFNVDRAFFNNSSVFIDSSRSICDDTLQRKSRIQINNSDIYVCCGADDKLLFTDVYIGNGGFLNVNGYATSSNFILTSNGNLYIPPNGTVLAEHICAFDDSTITFERNSDYLYYSKAIQTFDNARVNIIYHAKKYKDIFEYCNENDIEHTNTYGYFYKIVRVNDNNEFVSLHDSDFKYHIGKYVYPQNGFSEDDIICSSGIHCSSLNYVLREFGAGNHLTVLKLRVEFADLAVYEPNAIPQKLRCRKAFVEKVVDSNTLGPRAMLLNRDGD